MTQLSNQIDIIGYDNGIKIRQKEYFVEYFYLSGLMGI
jgi:hypothetical protein